MAFGETDESMLEGEFTLLIGDSGARFYALLTLREVDFISLKTAYRFKYTNGFDDASINYAGLLRIRLALVSSLATAMGHCLCHFLGIYCCIKPHATYSISLCLQDTPCAIKIATRWPLWLA